MSIFGTYNIYFICILLTLHFPPSVDRFPESWVCDCIILRETQKKKMSLVFEFLRSLGLYGYPHLFVLCCFLRFVLRLERSVFYFFFISLCLSTIYYRRNEVGLW